MILFDNEFVFPLHGECFDIPTQAEIKEIMPAKKLKKYNNLFNRYLAINMHIRPKFKLRHKRMHPFGFARN